MPDLPVFTDPAARRCEEAQSTKQSSRKRRTGLLRLRSQMTTPDPSVRNLPSSCAGVSRASRLGTQCPLDRDGRDKPGGHDEEVDFFP